ncbi:hypothetical protein [Leucobacter massiliensis]|uniref:Uncharacterized protein n=1 Tax=Leucobacter massiliensis TaxID=1686285 RepID=A0A2S9QNW6_9MICO|nr:hypothetical protein [Leucobacter massiliensis]PRI11269.1 hypothetical protein B4915_10525 [Leucobacter massiliensis]
MELPRTRELLPRVIWRDSSPSTNGELRELAAEHDAAGTPLPHGTLLATAEQTAGRGRLDRGWVMPPGTAVATSVLVRGFGGGGGGGGGPFTTLAAAAVSRLWGAVAGPSDHKKKQV